MASFTFLSDAYENKYMFGCLTASAALPSTSIPAKKVCLGLMVNHLLLIVGIDSGVTMIASELNANDQ